MGPRSVPSSGALPLAVKTRKSDDARIQEAPTPVQRASLVVTFLAMAMTASAQPQITTGVIDGTVVDSSGGVLPGVDVQVRNVETSLARALVSDSSGRFVALQLPPGRYTVTLKLNGFATVVQESARTDKTAARWNRPDGFIRPRRSRPILRSR